jgi:hypothetical protein
MKILSVKPGHDGAIAWLEDGELVFSLEGEKSGFERHTTLHLQTILEGTTPCAMCAGYNRYERLGWNDPALCRIRRYNHRRYHLDRRNFFGEENGLLFVIA